MKKAICTLLIPVVVLSQQSMASNNGGTGSTGLPNSPLSKACEALPALKKNALTAFYQAQELKDSSDNLNEISSDATRLNRTSAAIAAVSAALGMYASWSAAVAMGSPLTEPGGLGIIMGMKASILPSIGGGSLAVTSLADFGTIFALTALVSPIDSYFLGKGVYSLVTSAGQRVEIKTEDLRLAENRLREMISTDTHNIQYLLDNPPSTFENSRKLGAPMRDHMEKIASLGLRREKAAEAIYKMRAAEAEMMLMACLKN